jgi:hypothetical protein
LVQLLSGRTCPELRRSLSCVRADLEGRQQRNQRECATLPAMRVSLPCDARAPLLLLLPCKGLPPLRMIMRLAHLTCAACRPTARCVAAADRHRGPFCRPPGLLARPQVVPQSCKVLQVRRGLPVLAVHPWLRIRVARLAAGSGASTSRSSVSRLTTSCLVSLSTHTVTSASACQISRQISRYTCHFPDGISLSG